MRFFGGSLVGLFLLALTLGVLALAGQTVFTAMRAQLDGAGGGGMPAQERVFTANVQPVQPGAVVPVLTVFGEVRSQRTLELRAPRGGTVVWLADGFADGAAVRAGQVLVRLDPAAAQTERDLALSDLAKVRAQAAEAGRALALARDEVAAVQAQAALRAQALTRQTDLRALGGGSAAAVETAALAASGAEQEVLARRMALSAAESAQTQAETAVARQLIAVAEAERALAETVIRAEFDGRLNGVGVVTGGLVSANERLAELIDPAALEVSFRLSAGQFVRMLDAMGNLLPAPVQVALGGSAGGVVAEGRLARVGAAVGAGQTGRLVYAALGPAPGFRPGDFVTVRIEEPALSGVALLPATALGLKDSVLVLGPDDRLEERGVEVLRRQDDHVIIRVGDLAGREVVRERSPLLGAGIRIRPVRPEAAAQVVQTQAMVDLTPERRAALVAVVTADAQMPAADRAQMLAQLAQDRVPADVVARLDRQRLGG